MGQIVSFADLFKFDDSTSIDDAIAKIEKLDQVYSKLVASAEKGAAGYADSLNDIAKSASKLDGEMDSLDSTLKTHQDLIVKAAVDAEKLLASQEANTKALGDEQKAAAALETQQRSLQKAKDDLNKSTIKEAGSLAAMREELKKAVKDAENMGDATDELVKKQALDRVSELAKNVNTADAAIKQAKKGVDLAKGSYNALVHEVEAAKKELKAMEGGIGSNSAQFDKLQKTVKTGTEKLKAFDVEIGDGRRGVGEYATQISTLIPGFSGVAGAANSADSAFKVLAKNPLSLVLLAIAGALASLTAYFKSSVEGEDDLNKTMAVGKAILSTFMDIVIALGKALFKAISEPKKVWEEFLKIIKPVTDAITAAFNDPIAALKAFGEAIVENLLSRIQAVGVAFEAVNDLIHGRFKAGFKGLSDAVIQGATGVKDGTDKIAAAVENAYDAVTAAGRKLAADFEAKLALTKRAADLENQLKKDRIKDIVDDAQTEKDANELIVKSQDKLRFSTDERLKSLRAAGKLLQDQLTGDLALIKQEIDFQKLQIAINGENYAARQALAELQAKELNLQSEFSKALKKRQAQEIALINEAEKEIQDKINREMEAQRTLNEFILKARIASNKEIIADERTSLDDRIALLNENANIAEDIAKSALDKELEAAKQAAMARAVVNSKALDEIYNDTTLSTAQVLEKKKELQEEAIVNDQAYLDTVTRLNQQFSEDVRKINKETVDATADNVFKQWSRDYQAFLDKIDTKAATEALGLNEALALGEISLKDFNRAREEIQNEAQIKSIESHITYLEKLAADARKHGFDTIALDRQIAEARLALSDENNRKTLDGQTALNEKLKELGQVAFAAARSFIDSANAHEQAARDQRKEKLEQSYKNEIEAAGDNKEAKLAIEADYKAQRDKLEKEQRAADRKKAIFEKALAAVQIGINTAVGIAKAFRDFPAPVALGLSIVIGAMGALQLAAVLAKSIPQFAEGTDSAPGGWALVGEKGAEVVSGSKGTRVHGEGGPELVNLERGAKVYTAEESARMREDIARGDRMISGFDDDTQRMRHVKVEADAAAQAFASHLINNLNEKLDSLERTVATKKELHINVTREGVGFAVRQGLDWTKFLNDYYS